MIEDEKTGSRRKARRQGRTDPHTGQITTYFKDNPQLPVEEVKAHIFGGPRGAFITPPACGTHTTQPRLIPWSAPEGKDEFPRAPSRRPGSRRWRLPRHGGPAAKRPQALAGTESPARGQIQPAAFQGHREDGSQRLAKHRSNPAHGLHGQAGGGGECSDATSPRLNRAKPRKGSGGAGRSQLPCLLAARRRQRRRRRRSQPLLHPGPVSTSPAPTRAPRSAWWRSPPRWPVPSTSARWSTAAPSTSTRKPARVGSSPIPCPGPAGHADRPALGRRTHRAARLHPQPDLLLAKSFGGSVTSALGRSRRSSSASRWAAANPSPTSQSSASASKARQPRRAPRPSRRLHRQARRSQHRARSPSPSPNRSSSTRPTSARSAPACSSPPTSARRARSTAT